MAFYHFFRLPFSLGVLGYLLNGNTDNKKTISQELPKSLKADGTKQIRTEISESKNVSQGFLNHNNLPSIPAIKKTSKVSSSSAKKQKQQTKTKSSSSTTLFRSYGGFCPCSGSIDCVGPKRWNLLLYFWR